LAVREGTEAFCPHLGSGTTSPAWSPDGKIIACTATIHDANGTYMNIIGVRVDNGEQNPISSGRWAGLGQIAWLHDGSGMLTTMTDQASLSAQIWLVTYPSGEARRITNDLNDYRSVNLSADSSTIVAVHNVCIANLWIAPNGEAAHARQLSTDK